MVAVNRVGENPRRMAPRKRYPPIGDYALVSDCHSAALVSRNASIDRCCMPRIDQGSCFGRMLDCAPGGYCEIAPAGDHALLARGYLQGTLVRPPSFKRAG